MKHHPARKAGTLPKDGRIRLGTAVRTRAAGSAHGPAALLGNTASRENRSSAQRSAPKVLRNPRRSGRFTFAAASWTLTAHEARPPRDAVASLSRRCLHGTAIYAYRTAQREGGALLEYTLVRSCAEEAHLLQLRLQRAVRGSSTRAQAGKWTSIGMGYLEKGGTLPRVRKSEINVTTSARQGSHIVFLRLQPFVECARNRSKLAARFDARRFHDSCSRRASAARHMREAC